MEILTRPAPFLLVPSAAKRLQISIAKLPVSIGKLLDMILFRPARVALDPHPSYYGFQVKLYSNSGAGERCDLIEDHTDHTE